MIRGARDRHKEEGKLVIPEVSVDREFRQYWKGKEFPKDVQPLYGTQYDTEWHFDNWTRDWVSADKRHLRVSGTADWTDVWKHWKDAGKDYTRLGTKDEPLDPIQVDVMNKHCHVKVSKFESWLGDGHFGGVYKVKYQRKRLEITSDTSQPNTSPKKQFNYVWGPEWSAACKVMRLDKEAKKTYTLKSEVNSLLGDINILRYLKHENVVQMLDVVHIPDTETRFPFSTVLMLMELCDGDLFQVSDVCDDDLIPLVVVQKMMRNVCSGLQFMHNQNMVHFDIKPRNILYKWCASGRKLTMSNLIKYLGTLTFKLGDLGLCQTYDDDQPLVTTRYAGTTDYMSPEMKELESDDEHDPIEAKPCDICSLGLTLAFCVMDFQEFDDISTQGILVDYMAAVAQMPDSQLPQGINQTIASLINHMIQTDPEDRPTIDQVLNNQWLKVSASNKRKKWWQGPERNQYDRFAWQTFNKYPRVT